MTDKDDAARQLFADIAGYEWDPRKATANFAKHDIDFDDVTEVFETENWSYRTDRNSEERWTTIGKVGTRIVAVVFTRRGNNLRTISARRARKNEERAYYNKTSGRASKGKD